MSPLMHVPLFLPNAVSLAGVVVALVLMVIGARGRSRVTGIIGTVLILLSLATDLVYRFVVDPLLGQASDETLISILALQTLLVNVLTGAGLILLACAILSTGRVSRRERQRAYEIRRRAHG